ncbi:unnamed protein product [Echinostoma caproni]|uniref:Uncharacterized protein n=1 Tax=Echinostoma caproni TaxID=27848 RepID=A0A183B8L1_9TREM|nr:unnamed protein product [Echinostoma caproni]
MSQWHHKCLNLANTHRAFCVRFDASSVMCPPAHEPLSLSTLGLNVIRASRQVNPTAHFNGQRVPGGCTEGSRNHLLKSSISPSGLSTGPLAGVMNESDEMKQSFDLACLACGLKALSVLCPYRMAHLFCSHLHTSASLNTVFLVELHGKFVTSLHELEAANQGAKAVEGVSEQTTGTREDFGVYAAQLVPASPTDSGETDVVMSPASDTTNTTPTPTTNLSTQTAATTTTTPIATSILEQLFDSS